MANEKKPATTEAANQTAQTAPELTSAKLVEIQGKTAEAFAKLQGTKYNSPEYKDAKLELFKLDNEEKAEIANIKRAEQDAKVAEARNARIALVDNYDKATGDAKVAAREILVNELLARFSASSPAKKSGGEKSSGGKTKSETIADMMAAGNTYDEMIAAGMGDGTIRTVAGNLKYRKNADGTYTLKS